LTVPAEGIAIFQVLARQVVPFDYGNLPTEVTTGISPRTTLSPTKIYGTIEGRFVEDLFYHDDADTLLHTILHIFPYGFRVYPFWIAGHLQADYHDILTATRESPFGYRKSPVEFVSVPKVHLEFAFRNPLATETINPYLKWVTGVYSVRYVVVPETYEAVLTRRLRIPWFTIYGFKRFSYDFVENLKITKPIPVVAKLPEISSILAEWKKLGVWT